MHDPDEPADIGPVDLGWLTPADIDVLGDHVLGHAVRRRLKNDGDEGTLRDIESIAAYEQGL